VEPLRLATDLDFLLFRQSGVLSRRQALRYFSAKTVQHRLASGRWRRGHRAVYLTVTGPVTVNQRRWIASLAVGGGRPAVVAGLTALAVLGLRGYPDRLVHAAQWAGTDERAVTIVAAAFQQRLVGAIDVEPVLARMPRLRRRAVIAAAVADAAGGAESVVEIGFARLCRRAGLPEPSRQVVRRDGAGRKRYRDVYFDEWGVHVEVDGEQHMEVRAWSEDMRQHNEIVIAGERLLRFTSWLVRQRPDEVVAQVRAALLAAGWRP